MLATLQRVQPLQWVELFQRVSHLQRVQPLQRISNIPNISNVPISHKNPNIAKLNMRRFIKISNAHDFTVVQEAHSNQADFERLYWQLPDSHTVLCSFGPGGILFVM